MVPFNAAVANSAAQLSISTCLSLGGDWAVRVRRQYSRWSASAVCRQMDFLPSVTVSVWPSH